MTILVTNDDGIDSEGLKALAEALKELGKVFVVAPDRQRSAVGLSITLDRPLRIERVGKRTFSVDGMPADCVMLAIHRLMKSPPDLVLSGINDGQNIGYDIYHSGTVGAALVGTMFGIPSIAVSIANSPSPSFGRGGKGGSQGVVWYDTAAQMALKLARIILERMRAGMPALPGRTVLNVNVPNVPLPEIEGIEVTRHCDATYGIEVHHRLDPRGKEYYWLGGEFQGYSDNSENKLAECSTTDLDALHRRKVSITPIRLDITDYAMMRELSNWIVDSDQ